jgi:hypothetical protein
MRGSWPERHNPHRGADGALADQQPIGLRHCPNRLEYHALTGKAILSSWVPGMPPTCGDHQTGKRWPPFFRAGDAE